MPQPASIVRQYEQWAPDRERFLDEAERVAKLTLPTMRPKGTDIDTKPFTQLGARAVRSLASLLNRLLFPPSVKWLLIEVDSQQLKMLEAKWAQMPEPEAGIERLRLTGLLETMEDIIMSSFRQISLRSRTVRGIRRNLIEGTTAIHIDKKSMRIFPLRNFIVFREGGMPRVLITREEDIQGDVNQETAERGDRLASDRDWIYTYVDYEEEKVYQQLVARKKEDGPVKETDSAPIEWIPFVGEVPDVEHYATSYTSDQLPLISEINHLSQSLAEAAATAAWNVPLIRPGSSVTPEDLMDRPTGKPLVADPESLSWFTSGIKIGEWSFVSAHRQILAGELIQGFAMGISERSRGEATATEILRIAEELDTQTADLLTAYEETLQLPLVKAQMAVHGFSKKLAEASGIDEPLKITITTGQNAIGRQQSFLRTIQAGQMVKSLDPDLRARGPELMKRAGAAMGFEADGMFYSAQAQQQLQGEGLPVEPGEGGPQPEQPQPRVIGTPL